MTALVAAVVIGALPVLAASTDLLRDPSDAWLALTQPSLHARTLTSSLVLAAALAIAVPVGTFIGWAISRVELVGGRVLVPLVYLPLFLSPLVHALTWAGELRLRGFGAIVLVHALGAMPFVALFVSRAMDAVGRTHVETLRTLGGMGLVVRDELRQSWPAAVAGAALASVFILGDFAVADFLTSVGPKVTVAADSVYAHHIASRPAAAAAAALPIACVSLALLAFGVRRHQLLGASMSTRFVRAPRHEIGRARLVVSFFVAAWVTGSSVLPFALLARRTGSFDVFATMLERYQGAIGFTLATSAACATLVAVLALALAAFAPPSRIMRAAVLTVLLVPLAAPALTFGIGIVRVWNHPFLGDIYTGAGMVVLAAAGRYLLFGYLPIAAALSRIDGSLVDVARLAGADWFERLRSVQLPLVLPALAFSWCVTFAFALREMDALIMLRAGQSSMSHRLYSNIVFARADEIAALALIHAAINALPLVLLLFVGPARWRTS